MRALVNVQLPHDENGQYSMSKNFVQILQIIGLKPTDMPPDDNEEVLKEICLERAEPILSECQKIRG